jgi:uncharacterized protein (TIGR02594 family)
VEGLKLHGTLEAKGAANNPIILQWAKEVGGWEGNYYTNDSIPWCGLFAAVVAKRAGKTVVKNYLGALSWSSFGTLINKSDVGLGDILTFIRPGGGHVGFYIAEDATAYHVLGGNQSDSVNITRIAKIRLYSCNRPQYNNKPLSVKKYWMAADGNLSTNEA